MSAPVISSQFPFLPIMLTLQDQTTAVQALLDTGFEGAVVVPQEFIPSNIEPHGYVRWVLADGSRVYASTYDGTAWIDHFGPLDCAITAIGGEPIVGRIITDRFTITLDHGRRLIVEP